MAGAGRNGRRTLAQVTAAGRAAVSSAGCVRERARRDGRLAAPPRGRGAAPKDRLGVAQAFEERNLEIPGIFLGLTLPSTDKDVCCLLECGLGSFETMDSMFLGHGCTRSKKNHWISLRNWLTIQRVQMVQNMC